MKFFVVISCLLAASASASLLAAVPHVTTTQYHAQDELGQYSYGYSGGPSAKEETRTADGITRGSYSYVDANGIVQSASYVSDPVNGFRVAATNLPQAPVAPSTPVVASPIVVSGSPAVVSVPPAFDHVHGVPVETPEVIAAKAAHFAAHNDAIARLSRRWKRSLVTPAVAYSAPTAVAVAPDSTTIVNGPVGRSFSYSTVASAPAGPVSPASTTVIAAPVPSGRSFSYSSVASTPVSAAAPAPVPLIYSVASPRSFSYSTVAAASPSAYAYSAPVVSAPVVAPPTVVTAGLPLSLSSQYRTQDELGQYTYGYSDGLSSKTESRSADGVTHGGYSYVDSNGILQTVKYVADAAGFRVHATNLPVGPSV